MAGGVVLDGLRRKHREMMDLEGLKTWLPGRTIGFPGAAGFSGSGTLLRPTSAELMKMLPLFPVTTVGSWPRPPGVDAQRQLRRGHINSAQFDGARTKR